MGPSYPESVTSLQAQTFTSGKASLFVYIGTFWHVLKDMTYCSIYYALFVWLQTYLHFRTFLILHISAVGYAGKVYLVALDQLKNQAFQCRWFYSYSPRQHNKPWLRSFTESESLEWHHTLRITRAHGHTFTLFYFLLNREINLVFLLLTIT